MLLWSFTAFDAKANCPDVVASFTASPVNICGTGSTTISFVNTSTGTNNGSATYRWYRNGVLFDVTNGTGAPNTSTVSAAGTYTFRLIAQDASVPCSDTAFVTVTVHNIPNANFTFNNNNSCAGTTISFNNTSTGTSGATTYAWNFGDGQTSTLQNPTHVYAAGGTYNVTLTTTNFAGCSDVQTFTVTVLDIPNVSISGDDGDGDLNNCLLPGNPMTSETVTFTNTTTNAVSYAWNFGDGQTSTLQNPTHTYTSYGTYTVTMTATHANGCTATQTLTVVFEKYVSASLTLDITEYSGCSPHPLTTLSNLSVNANTYTWNFGDGTPPVTTTSSTPPAHVYNTAGTYTISLTAANSCNSASATISPIVIVGGPNSNFTSSLAGLGNLGCAPQSVTFSNLSSGAQPANNYQWNMGNGNTYTNVTNPPAQNYPTQGTYTVTLVAGNACGFDTTIVNYVIDSIPIANITATPTEGCTPLTVDVNNFSSGNNVNYAWYIDGVYTYNTYNIPDQVFTAPVGNATQTHTVSLTVSNHCGTRSDAESILVHPAVDARFTASDDSICVGQSVVFSEASYGDQLSWAWDFGNGQTAATQGPHAIAYNTPGTFQVKLIVTGFCGVDSLIRTVVVSPYPVADIVANPASGCVPVNVAFTNNSTTGGTYSWNFGSGSVPASSTLFTPGAVVYASPGTAQVVLQVTKFGCSSSDTLVIDRFPNPVPSFTLTPNNGCTPLSVAIANTSAVSAGDVYAWNLGNGVTSSLSTPPSQTYIAVSNDSVYTVSLQITTVHGCSTTVTAPVTVHPLPVADFTALPDTVCATTPIGFLNNSTGGISYAWNFGDGGTSAAISPSHTYATQGSFTTQLVVTSPFSCRDTAYATVVIDSIPNSDFNFTIECFGFPTQFTDQSTGSVTGWLWNFGDASANSTLQNPSHSYAAAGNYLVSLTTTNPAGCTHTQSQLVTINAVPVANFNANSFCLGTATQFTDLTSGVPVAWNWDFGDGSNSAVQHPTHVYAATGTYTVTLISFGGAGCSDTTSQTITITGIPTANFTSVPACATETTTFTSTSLGAPDTYVWNFGDGFSDNTNNPNPTHTYAVAGTYNVVLTAGYAASGCTHSVTIPVQSFPRTVPSFVSNTPCLGAVTNFTDNTTNAPTQWTWDLGDGTTSALQNPSHVYATPGTYAVQLITENVFGCIDSVTQNITVNPLPVAAFTNTVVCEGFASSFTDQSTSAVQWNWNFGDGSAIATQQNPFHLFPSNGTYTVELIVFNVFGCTDTIQHTVTVNPNPVASWNASTACFSYPTQFTDASVNAVQWSWNFDDGSANDITPSPSHTYPADGTYLVELIVTNVFGCKDTLQQNVVVLPQPDAAFVNTTVCAGQSVQFTDQSLGSPSLWNWNFSDGTANSATQHPIHAFANGGTFNVTLIAGNASGCLDTIVVPVTVNTVPDAAVTVDTVCLFNITHFSDLTTDASALVYWYWDFDDGNQSFSQNPTYIYQNPGVYNVSFTVMNMHGCDTTINFPVVVNDVPVASFTADTVCLGAPTTFTDQSTGFPTSWTWSFGDGTVISNGNAIETHVYANPGSYLVTLIASGNGNNCQDMTFGTVVVSTDAVAGVTLPDTLCEQEVFNYADNSVIAVGVIASQTWDMGDGTVYTNGSGTHVYAVAGNYIVTHTVTTNGGCASQIIDTIVLNPLPVAAFIVNSSCSGLPVQFTDASLSNIVTWDWQFGDGSSDVVQNPQHVFANAGTYNVSLTVSNAFGCSANLVQNLDVFGSPVADFTFNTVCWGTATSFYDATVVSPGENIASWSWDFGDGGTSTLEEDQHVFQVYNDTFQVTLIVVTDHGCSDTVTMPVTTLPIVEWDFGPDNANGCAPMEVAFTDNSVSTGTTTLVGWVWNFDDGTMSFSQNPNHMYPNAGQYFVSLQVTTSDGCVYTDTLDYPVTVYPQPEAGFQPSPYATSIYMPDILVTDESIGAQSWEYSFGDGYFDNNQNPEHRYQEPGTYTITQIVTNQFGCSDTLQRNIVILEEATFFAPNAVTPDGNGINDVFFVTGSGIAKIHWMVFDRWGELIFETEDLNAYWDVTHKGELVKQDVYVWKAEVTFITGIGENFFGHVTVIRSR